MSDSSQPDPDGWPPDPRTRKVALRTRLLDARRAMTVPQRQAANRRIQSVAASLVASAAPDPANSEPADPVTVTGYAPVGSEPGGPELPTVLARALPPGGRLVLPVLLPDLALDWAEYRGEVLLPGPRGVPAPPGSRHGVAAVGQAALVLVPALAVDRRGVRLGRGGGSYDRALAHVSAHARVVALLYDDELLTGDLPAEPHDRPVDAVITPTGGLVTLSRAVPGWPGDVAHC